MNLEGMAESLVSIRIGEQRDRPAEVTIVNAKS